MPTAARAPSILCLAAALALTGCAGAGSGAGFAERDPYEDTNRSFHEFNLALDRNVLRPVSQGYDAVTPTLIQHLLGNAFSHLDTVGDFANYLLQGEMEAAGTAFGRFTVNTILGAGGALDPATEFGLPKEDTDFGVTLGRHGVEEGAYLVLPFLGPSTTRDLGGRVGDIALSPLTYTGFLELTAFDILSPTTGVVEVIDDRNRNADLIDDVLYESEDSYISLRTIYLQRRDALIAGGDEAGAALPDIFDDDEAPAN
jgi:phospholipid-binding lipoprotein MlaA